VRVSRQRISLHTTAVGFALAGLVLAGFVAERGGLGRIESVEVRQLEPCHADPVSRTVSAPFAVAGTVVGGSRRVGARMTVWRSEDGGDPVAWDTGKVMVTGSFDTTLTVSVRVPEPVPSTPMCLYSLAT
jgi:hypothetical protein